MLTLLKFFTKTADAQTFYVSLKDGDGVVLISVT